MFERKFVHPFRPTAPAGAVTLTGMPISIERGLQLAGVALTAGLVWPGWWTAPLTVLELVLANEYIWYARRERRTLLAERALLEARD